MEKINLGFVGIGVMGENMARNLMQKGHTIHIYTRTKAKAEALIREGAIWHNSPKDLAAHVQITFTMVGYPKDVEEVIAGENGLMRHMAKGSLICDMTTSSPVLAEKLALECASFGIRLADAPVTGGDVGAKAGSLSIFVGADQKSYAEVLPYLEIMGKKIIYIGEAGSGQRAKLANQIGIAGATFGMAESILFAHKSGINLEEWLEAVIGGAAGSHAMQNLGPRVLKGNFEPGFYVEHFLKDLAMCIDECKRMNLVLPVLSVAENTFRILVQQGYGKKGTQVLAKGLAELSKVEL